MSDLPTNLNEELDKIFQDFYSYDESEEHISMPVGRAKKATKLLVQSICLSVIGEDEHITDGFDMDTNNGIYIRNRLRAEQILSLKDKIG